MILQRHRLAPEEGPPAGVGAVPDVHGRHVGQLVVHQGEEPLAGREGLEGLAERGDVDQDGVVRRSPRRGVAVVGKVLQQHGGLVPRLPAPGLLLEGHGVLEAARHIGRQIGLRRVEIEQPQILGLQRVQVDLVQETKRRWRFGRRRLGGVGLTRRRRRGHRPAFGGGRWRLHRERNGRGAGLGLGQRHAAPDKRQRRADKAALKPQRVPPDPLKAYWLSALAKPGLDSAAPNAGLAASAAKAGWLAADWKAWAFDARADIAFGLAARAWNAWELAAMDAKACGYCAIAAAAWALIPQA